MAVTSHAYSVVRLSLREDSCCWHPGGAPAMCFLYLVCPARPATISVCPWSLRLSQSPGEAGCNTLIITTKLSMCVGSYSFQGPGDRLCGLVVKVLGYRSGGPGSIPGTTRLKKSSGSGTGSTQPREYN
jgi:hypothetical protein